MKANALSAAHARLQLPAGLTDREAAYPTFFIDLGGADLHQDDTVRKVNDAMFKVLCAVHAPAIRGQALMKVHIGEPRCVTRMNPLFTTGSSRFLFHRGVGVVVAGDTTVAYTGPRGHRQNPDGNTATYGGLAEAHGWTRQGPAGVPFVVLDRPCACASAGYACVQNETPVMVDGIRRFKDFFPAGGFAAADFVINHAHLTLHGLAGVAGCIKSIAMGCSALPGKLRMHKSLLPLFDTSTCKNCGVCADNCPEQAMVVLEEGDHPTVDAEKCIGCGECVSVCPTGAVQLKGNAIEDWKLGEETLPERMADYALGLMNGHWDTTVHLMHLYSITKLCDCVNKRQKPMVKDIGFLLGKNPFAIDKAAGELLSRRLPQRLVDELAGKLRTAEATADYVGRHYGILTDTPMSTVRIEKEPATVI